MLESLGDHWFAQIASPTSVINLSTLVLTFMVCMFGVCPECEV